MHICAFESLNLIGMYQLGRCMCQSQTKYGVFYGIPLIFKHAALCALEVVYVDITGEEMVIEEMCVVGITALEMCVEQVSVVFQRLRYGQGLQTRHTQTSQNNMETYDQEFETNLSCGTQPKNTL